MSVVPEPPSDLEDDPISSDGPVRALEITGQVPLPPVRVGSGLHERPATIADRYEVEDEIGRGGNGRVYSAWDPVAERLVAVKVLHPELASTHANLERFVREIRVLHRLRHPGVVRVLGAGRTRGSIYVVTELLHGRTLAQYIAACGPMGVDEAAAVVGGMCDALDVVHERGVVHRDLKPANVFITDDGEVKLLDFGVAHVEQSMRLTAPGRRVGTPRFMSPEQIRDDALDRRTDVYALGVLTYEALVGEAAFTGRPGEVLAAIVRGAIPPLRERREDVPVAVADVVGRAMAVDPAHRFDSAGAFGAALEAASEASAGSTSG